jgi:hypothetical protein
MRQVYDIAAGTMTEEPDIPVVLSLPDAQAAQIAALYAACDAEMVGGFVSSALGAAYTYPTKPTDQVNLIGAATDANNPSNPSTWTRAFWCADGSGVWDRRDHTAAQMRQVMADGATAREALSAQLASLVAQVEAATTVAAVQAIVWTSPLA